MADDMILTVITDLSSPFVLSQSGTQTFVLTAPTTSNINIQLGASLTGAVNLVGPSSIKGFETFIAGLLNPNEILLAQIAPYSFTLDEASSSAVSLTAATSTSIFRLFKTVSNVTTQIGTITFAASGAVGVVVFTDPIIHKNDLITLYAPIGADASLADIAFLLAE